jgi:hypothetical protein
MRRYLILSITCFAFALLIALASFAWASEKEDLQAQAAILQSQIAQVTMQWAEAQSFVLNQKLQAVQAKLRELEAKEQEKK